MKPHLKDIPFLERHSVDTLAAAVAFRKAREAAGQGKPDEAEQFRQIGLRTLDRLEQLYEQEVKQNEKK